MSCERNDFGDRAVRQLLLSAAEVLRSDLLDWNVPGNPQEAGGREVTVEREIHWI
jgi:hypothetical protein